MESVFPCVFYKQRWTNPLEYTGWFLRNTQATCHSIFSERRRNLRWKGKYLSLYTLWTGYIFKTFGVYTISFFPNLSIAECQCCCFSPPPTLKTKRKYVYMYLLRAVLWTQRFLGAQRQVGTFVLQVSWGQGRPPSIPGALAWLPGRTSLIAPESFHRNSSFHGFVQS